MVHPPGSPRSGSADSFGRSVYLPRAIGRALSGLCIGAALAQHDAGAPWLWALLVFNALVWPHVAYRWAMRSTSPMHGERRNLLVDSCIGAFWLPVIGFNLLPSVLILSMLTMNNLSVGGSRLFVRGLLAQAAGASIGWLLFGGRLEIAATLPTIIACLPFLVVYPLTMGVVTYRLSKRLTQQKKQLERSEHLYRTTLDMMDAGIVLYDADDRLVLCNRDFRELYGEFLGELTPGRRFEDLLRTTVACGLVPEALGREEEWLRERLQRHASPHDVMLRELPGDRWQRIREQRLPDGSVLAFSTDVTDHVRKERALEQARQEAQRHSEALRKARDEAVAASSAKSAFVANMSHEIRTPLTSIIGFAELLLTPELAPDDKVDAVRTIIRNGRHLLEVINDILDLAKIETGQVEVERIPVELPILLRDLVTLVAGRATEKSLAFSIAPRLPLPAVFASDPVRLKQILLNFCSNAIKFTKRGSVRLEVRYAAEPPLLTFTVCDTGIGMTPVQVSRLFQPFMQADASTTRRFGGTGLGLYLSRQLAGALGAQIRVDSEAGRGSRFHLHLPLDARPADHALLTHEADLHIHERADFAVTSFSVPDLAGRVLLAEDGIDNQRLLAAYLQQAGLDVTVVDNGRDAVDTALRRHFDLILMDVQMPLLDGVAATEALRAAGYRRPIVALTANVMKSDLQRYRDAGCDDVLAKPVERDRFYDVIATLVAVDPAMREAMMDDAGFAHEIAALTAEFRAGLPAHIDAIRAALVRADWDTLRSLIHMLKGTAGSYGYGRLTDLSAEIEAELAAKREKHAQVLCEGLILEARGALLEAAR